MGNSASIASPAQVKYNTYLFHLSEDVSVLLRQEETELRVYVSTVSHEVITAKYTNITEISNIPLQQLEGLSGYESMVIHLNPIMVTDSTSLTSSSSGNNNSSNNGFFSNYFTLQAKTTLLVPLNPNISFILKGEQKKIERVVAAAGGGDYLLEKHNNNKIISTIRIPSFKVLDESYCKPTEAKKKKIVVYCIEYDAGKSTQRGVVFRRFGDFCTLHSLICSWLTKDQARKILVSPPNKHVLSNIAHHHLDLSFLENRRKELETYLQHVVEVIPNIELNLDFCNFLNVVTQNKQRFFYPNDVIFFSYNNEEEGDIARENDQVVVVIGKEMKINYEEALDSFKAGSNRRMEYMLNTIQAIKFNVFMKALFGEEDGDFLLIHKLLMQSFMLFKLSNGRGFVSEDSGAEFDVSLIDERQDFDLIKQWLNIQVGELFNYFYFKIFEAATHQPGKNDNNNNNSSSSKWYSNAPSLVAGSKILTLPMVTCLKLSIPECLFCLQWHPLFQSGSQGLSFDLLMDSLSGYDAPMLLLIRDRMNFVFGGLVRSPFVSEVGKSANDVGAGVLFSLFPRFYLFPRTKQGNIHLLRKNVGLSIGNKRLFLDCNFDSCSVKSYDEYFSPGNLRAGRLEEAFQVREVEVYGLGGDDSLTNRDKHRKWEHDFKEKRRQVDKSKFGENSFDREYLLANTFKASKDKEDR